MRVAKSEAYKGDKLWLTMTTGVGMKDVLARHAATRSIAVITAGTQMIKTLPKLAATAAMRAVEFCKQEKPRRKGRGFLIFQDRVIDQTVSRRPISSLTKRSNTIAPRMDMIHPAAYIVSPSRGAKPKALPMKLPKKAPT